MVKIDSTKMIEGYQVLIDLLQKLKVSNQMRRLTLQRTISS